MPPRNPFRRRSTTPELKSTIHEDLAPLLRKIENEYGLNTTVAELRKNYGDTLYPKGTNVETVWRGSTRYTDPLIIDHVIDKDVADDRRRVANEDPLGILVTHVFGLLSWSRMVKFYDSDELDAEPIMEMTRQILTMLHVDETGAIVTAEVQKHGWALTYCWIDTDENGEFALKWLVFSAEQIPQQDIDRDEFNRITAWHVRGRQPAVQPGYTKATLKPLWLDFYPGMDGLIAHSRGDFDLTSGYGISRLVQLWDPITKLRVESHGNAKRAELWPLVIYPPDWDQTNIDALFKSLSYIDETCGMALKAGKNDDGTIEPTLPSIAFRSPGEDAPNKTGDGGVRGLSSEFVRFCALSGITVKELSGDPGGAQEAGQTDFMQALEKNINEWNYSMRRWIQKVINQLARWDMEGNVFGGAIASEWNPFFVVKGHWEWERDEMALQQQSLQDQQMEIEEQKAKPTQNAPPAGVMMPITSSWVKAYGHGPSTGQAYGTGEGQDSLYLQFHGSSKTFEYPQVGNPEEVATEMEQSGSPGGFVHDHPALGVPARTPYEPHDRIPSEMGYFGSAQQTHQMAEQGRKDKMAQFGTKRPAMFGNPAGYPGQTMAHTEQTTYPLAGEPVTQGWVNSIKSDIGQAAMSAPAGTMAQPNVVGQPIPVQAGTPTLTTPSMPTRAGRGRPAADTNAPTGQRMLKPHRGRSRRGRPAAGMGFQQSSSAPDSTTKFTFRGAAWNEALAEFTDSNTSFKRFNELSSQLFNHTFSKENWERFKNGIIPALVVDPFEDYVRYNSAFVGNSMAWNHPLHYRNSRGGVDVEYACPKDWKEFVVGKSGPLKLNHDDDAPVVGSITWGWDEEKNIPKDNIDLDFALAIKHLEERGETKSPVYAKLKNNELPDISTEYYCNKTWHNQRWYQVNFDPIGAALVAVGNCPTGVCNFQPGSN